MEKKQLKETLTELHEELMASREKLDPETQSLLKQLSSDIDRICLPAESEDVKTVSVKPDQKEGMMDQLLHLTDEFEESHPQLSEVIGRVASALSRIGI